MSNYTKSTNFATKDNLTPGDPLKVVRGTEIDTEFNNIATAVATKTDNSAAAITGGSITGITDLAIADGGTGASTATAAINNLLPAQTSAANKYLQSDGTNVSWDAVTLSTADITGTLPVANGGTGVTSSTGTGNVVLSNSPTLVTPALGTPASGVATNITGLPISTGVSGLGTGVATFLGTPSSANLISAITDETGTGSLVFSTSPTLVTPALGTPSALVGTNITGTASGLTAGNVTTNANLTGAVTSVGNATSLGSFTSSQLAGALTDETGSGSAVFATSPTLVTPALGTPSSGVVTNLTGTASININGTVGATTATTGAFTTVTASSTATATSFIPSSSTVPTNGLFLPAANTLGLGTNSAEKVRVTSDGYLLVGTTYGSGVNIIGTNPYLLVNRNMIAFRDTVNASGPMVGLLKTRASLGTFGIVSNGDTLGGINFAGDNGVDYSSLGAQIVASVDGVPSSTSMAGRLVFSTTPSASITPQERVRITSAGDVGIGTSSPSYKLHVVGSAYISSKLLLDTGSVSAPPLSFLGWTNSGIYNPDGNSVAFTVNGTERGKFSTTGLAITGTLSASSTATLNTLASSGATLTGGTINGMTIGATTATTGAFTSLTASTTLGVTGVATFSAGTAALPALTTTGDTDTGFWFPAANTIAASTGGTERARIDSSGNLLVGTTTSSTGSKVTVNGQIATSPFFAINSSTVTTVAVGASFLAVFRDRTNGGTALVLYENNTTPVIVSQTTAGKFVTTTPSATQIQLANLSGGVGITALTGSSIGSINLNASVIVNQS